MIGETPLSGKEPGLTTLPDGLVALSAQKGYFGPGTKYKQEINLARSQDGGKTWSFSKGMINWDEKRRFGEVSTIRLRDGRLLATIRSLQKGAPIGDMQGFGIMLLTESSDDGKMWSNPRAMSRTAKVHIYLTELQNGQLLATYSNYYLPFGVYAIVNSNDRRIWDHDHPVQLALSSLSQVGWLVTVQLDDDRSLTGYSLTAYLKRPPDMFVTETVRWRLP